MGLKIRRSVLRLGVLAVALIFAATGASAGVLKDLALVAAIKGAIYAAKTPAGQKAVAGLARKATSTKTRKAIESYIDGYIAKHPKHAAKGEWVKSALAKERVTLLRKDREITDTLKRIEARGPYRYPEKDGSIFRNREEHLPRGPRED